MNILLLTLVLMPCAILATNELWQDYEDMVKKISVLKMDDFFLKDYDFVEASKVNRKFTCSQIPFSVLSPTSVHQLRPNDIRVVGAIGDSLTAANGAKASNVIQLLTEYRGVSWSIGGDGDLNTVVTLPNLIKQFNPNVIGFSVGTGKYNSDNAKFNVGQPGHTSFEIKDQAIELVKRIQESPDVDFKNDWKLVTLFIGGNDVCKACEPKYVGIYSSDAYIKNVRETLDYLKANMPRTLVNLVLALDVTAVSLFENTNIMCQILTTTFCRCGLDADLKVDALKMTQEIQAGTETLINSGRYDDKNDFTVVMQPFLKTNEPPKTADGKYDLSYFAPDCFHLSQKGHATMAFELWNNMFQKVGSKSTSWNVQSNNKLSCPSYASPYIYTSKNSN